MTNLWVSAEIELTENASLTEAEGELERLVAVTLKEPGCLQFEIRQEIGKPNCFILWECWENADALQAHYDAPHTTAYFAKNLTKINTVQKLQPLGASQNPSA